MRLHVFCIELRKHTICYVLMCLFGTTGIRVSRCLNRCVMRPIWFLTCTLKPRLSFQHHGQLQQLSPRKSEQKTQIQIFGPVFQNDRNASLNDLSVKPLIFKIFSMQYKIQKPTRFSCSICCFIVTCAGFFFLESTLCSPLTITFMFSLYLCLVFEVFIHALHLDTCFSRVAELKHPPSNPFACSAAAHRSPPPPPPPR